MTDTKKHPARFFWIGLLLLNLLLMTPRAVLSSDEIAPPFSPGEKLTFRLRWEFIPAGEATLEVASPKILDGHPVLHFVMTARSNAFIDTFYKVRDRIDAFTDTQLKRSLLYRKQQKEGSHHGDIEVRFDWTAGTAQYTNKDKTRDPIAIPPGTFDPLSALYYARQIPLAENLIIERPITDGKNVIMGKIIVIRRETITIDGRTYDTFVVEPDMQDVGGVFNKSPGAKMHVWLTADHRRIPVRIESEVAVGSFVGELISIIEPSTPMPPQLTVRTDP